MHHVNKEKRKIMKTTKLILSIILISLAPLLLGQRSLKIERLLPNRNRQAAHFISDRKVDKSRIEFWMHDTQGWASKKVSYEVYDAPVIARTIYVHRVDIIHEENLRLEPWMVAPFESKLEEELSLESWMTAPFEMNIDEEEPHIESWMITPWI